MAVRKPDWLKAPLAATDSFGPLRSALRAGRLHTVCEEARCPNRPDCWGRGTATFLLLGDSCTRGCAFCSVRRAPGDGRVDEAEPDRVAGCVEQLGLAYVVLTGVTRDDLPDGGAAVFARTVAAVRSVAPHARVEVLIPDYRDRPLRVVLDAGPDVLAHNIEVVRRLAPRLRHRACGYDRSLATLAEARRIAPQVVTKSSLLLGLGETTAEAIEAMTDLRGAGVEVLVLGQYLRPTAGNIEVARYVPPEEFDALGERAEAMGFRTVVAAPLARTSWRAEDAFSRRGSVDAG